MKTPNPETSPVVPAGPVAYLTGEYPKVSHTFIQREIAQLRAQGAEILTYTVRRANPRDVVGAAQAGEAARTFVVLRAASNPFRLIAAHAGAILRGPGRWLSALALAWQTRPPGLKAWAWQLFYFLEAGVLAAEMRARGVVHLHNHFANSSCSVAMLASEISAIPFSFTIHGPAIFFEPAKWRLDEKIARARFVACISHFCRSQAMLFSDQSHWGKLKIVHCGVTPSDYGGKARRSYGQRIIFVGRLDAVKGVPLLLAAFKASLAKHPDASLRIIGDGPDRTALEQQAKKYGIAERVEFLGYRDQAEIAALLQDADMLVLASFAEGVPVVLMEAMASHLPVIASRVAGVPELVEDGVSGFVIPPGDLDSLSARLDDLLASEKLCRKMGAAGRAKVEAEFDQADSARKLLALIRA